jgi:hypothetical protein
MRSGKIGREASAEEKEVDSGDFRTAEVKFDTLIRQKMQRGYEEVYEASKATGGLSGRDVRLVTLENNYGFSMNIDEFEKIVAWMIDPVAILDKRTKVPDLERWQNRALRLCRMREIPEDDEGFETFINKLREITFYDRSRSRDPFLVPGFKFTNPQYWIVNDKEADKIANACKILLNKRIRSRIDKGKPVTAKQELFSTWVKFNELATKNGGYEVRDSVINFVSEKGGHILGLDEWSYNTLIEWLVELDVLDEQEEAPDGLLHIIDHEKAKALQKYAHLDNYPLPEDAHYQKFNRSWRKRTLKHRCPQGAKGKIPFYKFTDPNRWLLNEQECTIIASKCQEAIEKVEDPTLLPLYADICQYFSNTATFDGCSIALIEGELQMAYAEYEEE